ncbi:VOC family protein [Nocardioides caricicola]|uniref:VOC family protein n=1 Tax=Nocardioides caricicola TaxID=634770 RepID=A0ABW0MWZ1_9ACTN
MSSQLVAVTYGALAPDRLAHFWAGLLGRDVVADGDGALLPGSESQVGLRFAPGGAEKVGLNRVHLHVTSEGTTLEAVVARAVELGARHLDVGQLPEEPHVVLADPEGNELCVIPPDNGFLAGCGPLGELACDGTRAVGVFWSEALGWPLVWDEGEETAVQSPYGGTKVAWGGPPVAPLVSPARQWFELVTDDAVGEVERLVSLGAARTGAGDGVVVLADPDGNEFRLRGA